MPNETRRSRNGVASKLWLLMAAFFVGLGVVGVATSPAAATYDNGGGEEVCYEQVAQAQYKKFTAPTDAGPWVLFGTWWQGQTDKWWPDTGEVAEGPGNHPNGRYTYRRVAQRVVDGDEIPCPKPVVTVTAPEDPECNPEGTRLNFTVETDTTPLGVVIAINGIGSLVTLTQASQTFPVTVFEQPVIVQVLIGGSTNATGSPFTIYPGGEEGCEPEPCPEGEEQSELGCIPIFDPSVSLQADLDCDGNLTGSVMASAGSIEADAFYQDVSILVELDDGTVLVGNVFGLPAEDDFTLSGVEPGASVTATAQFATEFIVELDPVVVTEDVSGPENCETPPTTTPPTTVPPTTTPPTTTPPTTVPPPTAAPPPVPPAGGLPVTGGDTTQKSLSLALIIFGVGIGLVGMTRRKSIQAN